MQERVGSYQLIEPLGQGGQGTVYLARRRGDGQQVALKLTRSTQEDQAHRLVREFRTLGRLRHPNLVRVYEHGRDGQRLFFAMEFIPGQDLDGLVRQRRGAPLDENWIRTVVEVAIQICSALEVIHQEGMVHRDVKPANIRLLPDGRAKLLDFGIVTATEDEPELTRSGHFVGSAPYIPPEQLMSNPVDARSDLYSLGATLYHLLAGRPPFRAGSLIETAIAVVQAPPPDLMETAPGVPPWLADVVTRLLSKDPRGRFQSARELRSALEQTPLPPESARTAPLEAGLVGRESELRVLREALEAARAGRGQVVLIAGEPGIGKSRLIRAVLDLARLGGVRSLQGSCFEDPAEPFAPIQPWIEGAVESAHRLAEEDRLDLSGEARALLASAFPAWRPLLGDRPAVILADQERRGLSRFLPTYLTRALESSLLEPCLLVLEDLHWADSATREVLVQLARRLEADPTLPLLILGSMRPGELPSEGPLVELMARLQQDGPGLLLEPGSLTRDQVAALIDEQLGETPRSARLPDHLLQRSGGNPLFVLELIRLLDRPEHGPVAAAPKGEETGLTRLGLPRLIQEMGHRWTERLGSEGREVLELMAVVGVEIPYRLLRRAAGPEENRLLDLLADLLRSGLLQERFPRGRPVYAFRHAVLREAVLEGIDPDRVPGLHLSVARAMEELGGPDKDWPAGIMAAHFEAGAEPVRAAELYLEAGRLALHLGQPSQAERLLQDSLHNLEAQPEEAASVLRIQGLVTLAGAAEAQGALDSAREHAQEARSLAKAAGHRREQAEAGNWLASIHLRMGRPPEARRLAAEALALFREIDDLAGMVATANTVAVSHALEGRRKEALTALEELLGMARRLGEVHSLASALNNYGAVLVEMNRPEEGGPFVREGLALREPLGRPRLLAESHANLGLLALRTGDLQEADHHLTKASEAFGEARDPVGVAGTQNQRGIARIGLLRWGEALVDLRESLQQLEQLPAKSRTDLAIWALAGVCILIGQNQIAEELLQRALEALKPTAFRQRWAHVIIECIGLDLRRNRLEEARRLYRENLADQKILSPRIEILVQTMVDAAGLPGDRAAALLQEKRTQILWEKQPHFLLTLCWFPPHLLLNAGRPEEALRWIADLEWGGQAPAESLFPIEAIRLRALRALDRPEEAEEHRQRAADQARRVAEGLDEEDRTIFLTMDAVRALIR